MTAYRQAFPHRRQQLISKQFRDIDWHRPIRNDDELVPAQPGDHARASGGLTKPLGKYLDEPIADGMAEAIVNRLQPVEVEIQHGDRSGLSRCESVGKVRNKRSTIAQTGQIVMIGQIAKLLFSGGAGLDPRKHARDCLERTNHFRLPLPLPATEFDDAQRPGCHLPCNQWCDSQRGRRGVGAFRDPMLVSALHLIGLDHD